MSILTFKGKIYETDEMGFLLNPYEWDENFAEGICGELKIESGLTPKHWEIIYFLRESFEKFKSCPLVYVSCRSCGIGLRELKELFPTGYHRGACKIAGFNYKLGFYNYWIDEQVREIRINIKGRIYAVDLQGFLINSEDWTTDYAEFMADKSIKKLNLTKKHWEIISFIQNYYRSNHAIPTIYNACELFQLELNDLENLFPDGYHRGLIKLAGFKLF